MGVQTRLDNTRYPFTLSDDALVSENETVLTDAGRSGDMARFTLMSKVSASGKWVPFTSGTATDGSQFPRGILLATLSEAEIKAGDVVNVPILRRSIFDQNQLVIETGSLTTTINEPANTNTRVVDWLISCGLVPEDTVAVNKTA